jgi:uncharacterized membrane protein YdjX (TVP38/TMEM64 family)
MATKATAGSGSEPAMVAPPVHHAGRGLALVIFLAVLLMVAQPIHAWLLSLFDAAESIVREQPQLGMMVFVLLAGLSAMVAFVSSAVLVPAAVYVWGPAVCFLLLWSGWFLGALAAYALGRYAGRPLVKRLVRPGTLDRYEEWARSDKSLVPILIFQLALPTDLAGYVFGLVRCRLSAFVPALALAEIPYALGAVYLGTSFLRRNIASLVVLGSVAVLASWWAIRRLHEMRGVKTHPADEHRLSAPGGGVQ